MTSKDDLASSLKAQMHHPRRINAGWPHWGRDEMDHGHAIFAVAAYLRALGLHRQVERFIQWLGHYDGFERYVNEGQDPCMCVRDVLAGYANGCKAAKASGANEELLHKIVQDIARLDFLRYRAFWSTGALCDGHARLWNPLKQTWLSFIEYHLPGEEIWVWQSELQPYPSLPLLREQLAQG